MHLPLVKRGLLATLVVVALISTAGHASAAAILLHQYQLNGTYADAQGGPSLVPNGGTLGPTGYTFDQYNQYMGLALSGAIAPSDYSIVLDFSFYYPNNVQNLYGKLIDFANLSSDTGLYDFRSDSSLGFFVDPSGGGQGGAAAMPADTALEVVLTRNGSSQTVAGYVNRALQFSFLDAAGDAVFTGPNDIVYFFMDDLVTNQAEAVAGFVDDIRIYDGALSADEVASLPPPVNPLPPSSEVPEPTTLLLLGCGLVMCARRWPKILAARRARSSPS